MKILIADDHTLFRDGLRSLLEARGIEVVGESSDGVETLEVAARARPDIVLMDLTMPKMDGFEATRRLRAEHPEIKIVVLTASTDDESLFEAIKAGAEGFLLKDLEADHFFDLLAGVARGEPALTPALARRVLQEMARDKAEAPPQGPDHLTAREFEVLEAMVEGTTSNRALAEALGISENTIKFHVRNILDKLHLKNRTQAVGYALRHGIVDPDVL
ncbi:MAG: response regulator transcription factor [Acidobacteriota bacterium]